MYVYCASIILNEVEDVLVLISLANATSVFFYDRLLPVNLSRLCKFETVTLHLDQKSGQSLEIPGYGVDEKAP